MASRLKPLSLLAALLTASPAAAGPWVSLTWSGCPGPHAVSTLEYSGPGPYVLFVTAVGVELIPGEACYGHSADIGFAPDLPDFWRYDGHDDGNPTGCQLVQGGSVEYSSQGLAGCGPLRNGPDTLVARFRYDDATRFGYLRMEDRYPAGRIPVATTTYLLFRITFQSTDLCAGGGNSLCVHLLESEFAIGPDPSSARRVRAGYDLEDAYWNDAQTHCLCGCVSTRQSTWGRVKALYR